MGVTLRSGPTFELRWWWEPPSAGEPVAAPDVWTARLLVASFGGHPEHAFALRRFLVQGEAWQKAPLDSADLLEHLAVSLAAGRVRMAKLPPEPLPAFDVQAEEEAASARPAPRAQPAPEQEEVCWPCLQKAAASARALREAAAGGAPYIVEG